MLTAQRPPLVVDELSLRDRRRTGEVPVVFTGIRGAQPNEIEEAKGKTRTYPPARSFIINDNT
jgi:hypothetical protein